MIVYKIDKNNFLLKCQLTCRKSIIKINSEQYNSYMSFIS